MHPHALSAIGSLRLLCWHSFSLASATLDIVCEPNWPPSLWLIVLSPLSISLEQPLCRCWGSEFGYLCLPGKHFTPKPSLKPLFFRQKKRISKKYWAQWSWVCNVAQLVEYLPSTHDNLGFILSTTEARYVVHATKLILRRQREVQGHSKSHRLDEFSQE